MRVHRFFGYIIWAALLCFMIFVPISSIVHWFMACGQRDFWQSDLLSDKNEIRAWMVTFPLMGLANFLYYLFFIHDFTRIVSV